MPGTDEVEECLIFVFVFVFVFVSFIAKTGKMFKLAMASRFLQSVIMPGTDEAEECLIHHRVRPVPKGGMPLIYWDGMPLIYWDGI